jgi:hypothetical protein
LRGLSRTSSLRYKQTVMVSVIREFCLLSVIELFPHQIRKVIASLTEQYKAKEGEFEKFKEEYNIRPAGRI